MHTVVARCVFEHAHDTDCSPVTILKNLSERTFVPEEQLGKHLIENRCARRGEIFCRTFHPLEGKDTEQGTVNQNGRNGNGGFLVSLAIIDLFPQPHHRTDCLNVWTGCFCQFNHRPGKHGGEGAVIHPIVLHPEHLFMSFEIGVIGRIPTHLHHQDHRRRKGNAHPQDIDQRRNACLSEYFHRYSSILSSTLRQDSSERS